MKLENFTEQSYEICAEIEDQAEERGLTYTASEMHAPFFAHINSDYFLMLDGSLMRGKIELSDSDEKTFTGDTLITCYKSEINELYTLGKPESVGQLIDLIEKD